MSGSSIYIYIYGVENIRFLREDRQDIASNRILSERKEGGGGGIKHTRLNILEYEYV
jgi:hypothetical protein